MTPGDVDAGLRLCRQSRWNQVARDWEPFLDKARGSAHVAITEQDEVVGSVATIRYPASPASPGVPTLAWVAMVLVDPELRGRGIGTSLLEQGLASAADVTTVGLDATPLGQRLYERLGFCVEETLTRMEGAAGPVAVAVEADSPDAPPVRPMTPEDLVAVARLDAQATGLERSHMLRWLRDGAPQLARVATDGAGVTGFVLGRRGHLFDHVGPVVATSVGTAVRLIRACMQHQEHPLIVDLVDGQHGLRAAAEALGFAAQRPFTRMYRGDWRPAAGRRLAFAVIGPEFG